MKTSIIQFFRRHKRRLPGLWAIFPYASTFVFVRLMPTAHSTIAKILDISCAWIWYMTAVLLTIEMINKMTTKKEEQLTPQKNYSVYARMAFWSFVLLCITIALQYTAVKMGWI